MRALWPHANGAEWDREVVRNDDQRLDTSLLFSEQAFHCIAAEIHIRLRLRKLDRLVVNHTAPDVGTALLTFDRRPQPFGEHVHEHKAEVVSRLCVFRAGITEPNDQPIQNVLLAAFATALGGCLALDNRLCTFLDLRLEFGLLDRDHVCDDRRRIAVDLDALAHL